LNENEKDTNNEKDSNKEKNYTRLLTCFLAGWLNKRVIKYPLL
jgi:hypothetical protein